MMGAFATLLPNGSDAQRLPASARSAIIIGGPVLSESKDDEAPSDWGYMTAKYIFITGGVVSSVGKGITTAAIGRLLKARNVSVVIQKLDPYLNVDPGTMSPYQHGEVYVTADGAETDLDPGHYEPFLDQDRWPP